MTHLRVARVGVEHVAEELARDGDASDGESDDGDTDNEDTDDEDTDDEDTSIFGFAAELPSLRSLSGHDTNMQTLLPLFRHMLTHLKVSSLCPIVSPILWLAVISELSHLRHLQLRMAMGYSSSDVPTPTSSVSHSRRHQWGS